MSTGASGGAATDLDRTDAADAARDHRGGERKVRDRLLGVHEVGCLGRVMGDRDPGRKNDRLAGVNNRTSFLAPASATPWKSAT